MESRTSRQITNNIIWNGISIFISSIISFMFTPYVTSNIGIEANGFVSLANTCITYINIITVALNAFAARYIAIEYHNKKYKEANEFYSTVLIADIILAVLVFIPCSALIWKLHIILNIPDGLVSDVKILFILVLIKWAIGVIGTAFTVVAFIKNMTSITYRNEGISTLLYAITLGGLIYYTYIHVYYMAIGLLVAAVFNLCMNFYFTRKLAPELKIDLTGFSWKKVKKLLSSGIWNSINNIGNLLNSGLDLLVCNKLLSSLVMGQVSVAKQLSQIMTIFTNVITNAFQPKQLEAYAKGDKDELIMYFVIAMKATGIIGNVLMICFLALGQGFISLWLPGQDFRKIYVLTVIVLMGDILVTSVRPLYYVFTLTDRLRSVCWITICSGVVNVISMFVLIKNTRLEGYAVVGTTMILNLIVQFWAAPYFAAKYLKLERNVFTPVILRHIGVFGMAAFITTAIPTKIVLNSWGDFLKMGLLLGMISFVYTFVFELKGSERKILINVVKTKVKRS